MALLTALGLTTQACDEETRTPPCVDSQPGSGFLWCEDGIKHRASVEECKSSLPRDGDSELGQAGAASSGDGYGCSTDAECTTRAHGHSEVVPPGNERYCVYGCVKDSECPGAQVCICSFPVGHCGNAKCHTDDETLLTSIAADETRHAELAWRFVDWALSVSPGPVAALLDAELARGPEGGRDLGPELDGEDPALAAWGALPESRRRALKSAVFREVFAPCARALQRRAAGKQAVVQVLSA